jgi:lipopolysaccharide biosynthesis protein
MNWINVKDKLPELGQKVLAYRNYGVSFGGYPSGIYIAIFAHINHYIFIIADNETNHNNYRPMIEFSHWMSLPEKPQENK